METFHFQGIRREYICVPKGALFFACMQVNYQVLLFISFAQPVASTVIKIVIYFLARLYLFPNRNLFSAVYRELAFFVFFFYERSYLITLHAFTSRDEK